MYDGGTTPIAGGTSDACSPQRQRPCRSRPPGRGRAFQCRLPLGDRPQRRLRAGRGRSRLDGGFAGVGGRRGSQCQRRPGPGRCLAGGVAGGTGAERTLHVRTQALARGGLAAQRPAAVRGHGRGDLGGLRAAAPPRAGTRRRGDLGRARRPAGERRDGPDVRPREGGPQRTRCLPPHDRRRGRDAGRASGGRRDTPHGSEPGSIRRSR